MATSTRRRGVDLPDDDDEIQLIGDNPTEITFKNKDVGEKDTAASHPRIGEENHTQTVPRKRVRHRLVALRQKLTRDTLAKKGKQTVWWVTVAVLGLAALLLLAVPLLVSTSRTREDCRDFEKKVFGEEYEEFPFIYSPLSPQKKGKFEMCRRGHAVLTGSLGTNHTYFSEVKVDVYAHSNNTLLNITRMSDNCLRIEWVGLSSRQNPLRDCYELGDDAFWYASYEAYNQAWTVNDASFPRTSFVPKDYLSPLEPQSHVFGSLLHPLWLSSKGAGIHVDSGVQLYVSMENKQLCLYALPFELECAPGAASETFFNYSVCVFDTLALTAKHFLANSGHIPHASKPPSEAIFQDPVWSTSNISTSSLNDSSLQKFYNEIINNDFNISLLKIDEGYSQNDGDLLFPDGGITTGKLLQLSQNVRLSAWVHPFVNYNTTNFTLDLDQDFYLPSLSEIEGNSVSLVRWWRGYGAVINFLKDTVREDQAQRFENFVQSNHLRSLNFDGGEYTYLPKCVYTENFVHPADYVRAYVKMVGNASYSASASVRVGYFTQDQSIFVRLLDRNFTWDENNGLRSVLNAIISLGLGGYPFIIPSKIGGNVTSLNEDSDRDLYMRWTQLNAFLPVMEFAFPPWMSRNDAVMSSAKRMTELHSELVKGQSFRDALSSATMKGYPIVRPLWWLADKEENINSDLFAISDQFLVGDMIMAAPILLPNTTSRDVYFPKGTNWKVVSPPQEQYKCNNEDTPCAGRKVRFNVPLNETLYFSKV